jgi:hypothetical protein
MEIKPRGSMNWWQRFKRSSAHTQANIVCTFIVMVATIVYAIVSASQLHVMSDQLSETKLSVAQNDTQFKLDERPYIAQTIKSTSGPSWYQNPHDNTKGQITWDWHMTNYGKTPAQNITFTQEIKLVGRSWQPSHGEVAPNIGPPQVQGQDVFDTVISDEIPRTEYDRLMQITDGVSIRIKIHYTSLDGTAYDTGLCLSRTNAGSIPYCKTDNYIH